MAGKPFFTRLVPSATVRGAAAMVGSRGHCWLELLSQRGACQAATVANSSLKFYPHHRFDAMEMYGNVPLVIFPDVLPHQKLGFHIAMFDYWKVLQ
jgi:hypothetical protein